jgi:heme A synthase
MVAVSTDRIPGKHAGPVPVIHNRLLHGYAVFVAVCTWALIAVSAAVTTSGAGLSIPDWPLSNGELLPRLNGLAELQFVDRVVAAVATVATVGLGVWLWRRECRASVKWLGFLSIGLIAMQVVLGGFSVLLHLPKFLSVVHACLAQLCLGLVSVIAVVTGRGWRAAPALVHDFGWPTLRSLAIWTPILVWFQILLGALFRYRISGVIPHIMGALLVTSVLMLFSMFVLTQFPRHEILKRAAMALLLIVFVQLMLGVVTYMSGVAADGQSTPGPLTVFATVAHVSVGGVLFVASIVLGLQVRRNVLPKPACRPEASAGAVL